MVHVLSPAEHPLTGESLPHPLSSYISQDLWLVSRMSFSRANWTYTRWVGLSAPTVDIGARNGVASAADLNLDRLGEPLNVRNVIRLQD